MSVQFKALMGPQDQTRTQTHTHTHTQDRLKTKWYAHMWIRACVCVCVCQRSAVCVGSHQVNWESRLVTAGLVAGVEGSGLVLHGQPWFQLNQGLTLIPAPHTDVHEVCVGLPKTDRGLFCHSPCHLPLWVYSQVKLLGQSRNINISAPCRCP